MLWPILTSSGAPLSHAQLGSRPIAMGGAFSGLAQLTTRDFTGTYNTDWKKLDHDFSFALAIPTKHTGDLCYGLYNQLGSISNI